MPTVLITGASGMVGSSIQKLFADAGYTVRTLVRDKTKANGVNSFYWNYYAEEIDLKAFEGTEYLINLSGATVSKRWTLKYKKEIYDSRIMTADFLHKVIKANNFKIKKYISVSGTGYYGNSTTENLNENSPSGNDFLAMVCRDWEAAAKRFTDIKIPVCILRLGVVMHPKDGFVKRVGTLIKFFAGAHLGSGKQIISWIGLNDLSRLFLHVAEKNLVGIYNATATNPMTLEEIDNGIATYYHRKIILPNVPAWALKLALGEMSEIVLCSCHVSNAKIKTTGFVFNSEEFLEALKE